MIDERSLPPVPAVGETVTCSRASVLCGVPALLGVVEAIERRPGTVLTGARIRPACELSGVRRVVIVLQKEPAS